MAGIINAGENIRATTTIAIETITSMANSITNEAWRSGIILWIAIN